VWWIVAGFVAAAATARWLSGRDVPVGGRDDPERVPNAFQTLRRRRTAIASAQEGPVLIRGKVSAFGEPLTSPLEQRACVFYQLHATGLVAPLHAREARPFLVTDDTGTAEVAFDNLTDVCFFVAPQLSLSGRKLRANPAMQAAVLKLGVSIVGVTVTEAAIFVGDTVTVAGVGRREATPSGEARGFRDVPTRYVLRGDPDCMLAVGKRTR
jgi:hypothetical protein